MCRPANCPTTAHSPLSVCPTLVGYWSLGQEWSFWADRMPWVKVLARSSTSTVGGIKSLLRVALCHVGTSIPRHCRRKERRSKRGTGRRLRFQQKWLAEKLGSGLQSLFKRAPWVPSCPPLLLSTQNSQSLSIWVVTVLCDV